MAVAVDDFKYVSGQIANAPNSGAAWRRIDSREVDKKLCVLIFEVASLQLPERAVIAKANDPHDELSRTGRFDELVIK